jgi:multiple sugar transport system permease protein
MTAVALAGPALIWFSALMLVPLAFSFVVSTLRWNGLLSPFRYTGLDNYGRLLADERFAQAAVNSTIQVVVGMVVVIPLACFLGFFLSRRPRGHRVFEALFLTPVITSTTAKAVIFIGLFLPDGMVNTILRSLGLESLTRYWLGDPATALGVIIALDVWVSIGFSAVLISAALSNVPPDLYEAAELDGAGLFDQMRRIALPLITDFIGVVMMLQFIGLLVYSAQNVLLVTQGGPGSYSLNLSYYMYDRAFVATQLGYSQAIAVVLFTVGLIGMLALRAATRRTYEL